MGRRMVRTFALGEPDDFPPVRGGERWVLQAKGVFIRLEPLSGVADGHRIFSGLESPVVWRGWKTAETFSGRARCKGGGTPLPI